MTSYNSIAPAIMNSIDFGVSQSTSSTSQFLYPPAIISLQYNSVIPSANPQNNYSKALKEVDEIFIKNNKNIKSNQEEEERNVKRRVQKRYSGRKYGDILDNAEQKLIMQAIENSKRETRREEYDVPDAPTYYPTVDEFRDPLKYITAISKEAQNYGICRIIPPHGWDPVCNIDFASEKKFPTKFQEIHKLQQSVGFDDGKEYTFAEYRQMSEEFSKSWREQHYSGNNGTEEVPMTEELLEKEYWSLVETQNKVANVEYGNDLSINTYQSGFPSRAATVASETEGTDASQEDRNEGVEPLNSRSMFTDAYYARTGWNLINLPSSAGSLLKYIKSPINGINVPWLYMGMLFSTFCWHNEDNYMYSINYSHIGDTKQWYGVPGKNTHAFEKAARNSLLELFTESPDLLQHMTTQISPACLHGNGVPVYKVKQLPKTFIVTFPKAFHCGFSYGFNCGEAVNFALDDWIPIGNEAEEKYRVIARPSVFSHQRLLFTLFRNNYSIDWKYATALHGHLLKIIDEELATREYIYSQGIRDISSVVTLPKNDFSKFDSKDSDFDDMRTCFLCQHVCLFSAVACYCNEKLVVCMRHAHKICKCKPNKQSKYLMQWASDEELRSYQGEILSRVSVALLK